MPRRSPVRHRVRRHKRLGKWIDSFERGSGTKRLKRKSRVVTLGPEKLKIPTRKLIDSQFDKSKPEDKSMDGKENIRITDFKEIKKTPKYIKKGMGIHGGYESIGKLKGTEITVYMSNDYIRYTGRGPAFFWDDNNRLRRIPWSVVNVVVV